MPVEFTTLITDCLVALGDSTGAMWSRTNVIMPWCKEAMLAFPILRPMLDDHTQILVASHVITLPDDFREMISVEYPISQTPPHYCVRKSRLDVAFYTEEDFYDVDHDYSAGIGWTLYMGALVTINAHVKTQYLANHDLTVADNSTDVITVPDEYENILVAYVVAKAYRERLSRYMQDPTAHTSIIQQMTVMVTKSEEIYQQLVLRAQARLADSRTSPKLGVDKFDRVY